MTPVAWIESREWYPSAYVRGGVDLDTRSRTLAKAVRYLGSASVPGTVMQSSKLGYQTWAIAAYLMSTNLKGISSMKLHREVDITQKSAWHLAHRLRTMLAVSDVAPMAGPVETDETKRLRYADLIDHEHSGQAHAC